MEALTTGALIFHAEAIAKSSPPCALPQPLGSTDDVLDSHRPEGSSPALGDGIRRNGYSFEPQICCYRSGSSVEERPRALDMGGIPIYV
jgi:hypothetical protein